MAFLSVIAGLLHSFPSNNDAHLVTLLEDMFLFGGMIFQGFSMIFSCFEEKQLTNTARWAFCFNRRSIRDIFGVWNHETSVASPSEFLLRSTLLPGFSRLQRLIPGDWKEARWICLRTLQKMGFKLLHIRCYSKWLCFKTGPVWTLAFGWSWR